MLRGLTQTYPRRSFSNVMKHGIPYRAANSRLCINAIHKQYSTSTTVKQPAADATASPFKAYMPRTENPELQNTFYQRKLPEELTKVSSPEGKLLFREAMDAGQTEGFFPLTGAFASQSSPSYCGPSSLALVLNALNVDPKKIWKGAWRWYSDDMLHCCSPKEQMQKNGITFDQFACLAKCHCNVVVKRATNITFDEFLEDLEKTTASSDQHMVISFSRKTLGQTGDGHFSPIGAFHPKSNKALVLDTARFKYPSYWCSAKVLYDSLMPIDKETGRSRGYFLLSYDDMNPPISLCHTKSQQASQPMPSTPNVTDDTQEASKDAAIDPNLPASACKSTTKFSANTSLNWSALAKVFCQKIPEDMWLEKPQTLQQVVHLVLRNVPREFRYILGQRVTSPSSATANSYIDALFQDTVTSPLYPVVYESLYPSQSSKNPDTHAVFATLFLLGSPRMLYTSLPRDLQKAFDRYRSNLESMPLHTNRDCLLSPPSASGKKK
ncbi:hypothetical protein NQZ79_g6484 [Umbelopsis isabellina]|nr:hypothetical protein NQZ79_g6484 [Umbelopsis isabellina]